MRTLAALLALLACSCASRPALQLPDHPIVWPEGASEPRIELLWGYHGTSRPGGERTWWQRLVDFLAGGETRALEQPCGIVDLPGGELVVADTSLGVLHRLDPERGEHAVYGPFDLEPRPTPIGVAATPDGRLFVTDSSGARVLVLAPGGRLERVLGGPGELQRPTGIVWDARGGRLIVADALACQLVCYDTDGGLLGRHGRRGVAAGEFNFPVALALDRRGRVLVVDSLNHRVQVLSPELEPVSEFGLAGTGPGSFARPKSLAVDSEEHVYVLDGMFDNVQIFDPTGQLLLTFGRSGSALGELYLPTAIHVDASDRITIADAGNSRIQVLRYLGERP